MWYLNKIGSANFVDDNEILWKIILLRNIFNSLEMQFEIEFNSKNLEKFQACVQLGIVKFSNLFREIGLEGDAVF